MNTRRPTPATPIAPGARGGSSPAWRMLAVLALALAACGQPALRGPATPAGNANICSSGAAAVNPAAPGVGGTGAPVAAGRPGGDGGIGGTGQAAQQPGSGGTGLVAQRPGIGGTGSPQVAGGEGGIGGTGIVGVITGFASVCVNGVELHYRSDTPVLQGERSASVAELQVGQVVAVRADAASTQELQPGAQLQAQRIVVLYAAVGPLTQLDASSGQFEVMGQRALALAPDDLAQLRVGDWARVSGHRLANGDIRASRVQGIAANLEPAQVLGPVTAVEGNRLRIGNTPVQASALPADTSPGRELSASGQWDGTRLVAQRLSAAPTRAGLGQVQTVLLQGHVHSVQGRQLRLGYESLQLKEGWQIEGATSGQQLQPGQRVQVRGVVGADQRITVQSLRINSESGSRGSNAASNAASGDDSSGRGRGRGRGGDDGSSGSGSASDGGSDGSGRGRGRGGDSGGSGGSGTSGGSGSGRDK